MVPEFLHQSQGDSLVLDKEGSGPPYKRGSHHPDPSNRGFADWGQIFIEPAVAAAVADPLLHNGTVLNIRGQLPHARHCYHADPRNDRLVTDLKAAKGRLWSKEDAPAGLASSAPVEFVAGAGRTGSGLAGRWGSTGAAGLALSRR